MRWRTAFVATALLSARCAEPASTSAASAPSVESVVESVVENVVENARPSSSAASSTSAATTYPARAAPSCAGDMVLVPETTLVVGAATKQDIARGSPSLVRGFCLDRTEVTTDAYVACIATGDCTKPLKGGSCSFERDSAGKRPINCVSFVQASGFCTRVGKRLPTEAEWESAASGGARTYPWGPEAPGKLVCWDGRENALGYGKRHDSCDVGTFAGDATPEGVLDLGGNISEWTVSDELGANTPPLATPTSKARPDLDQLQARKGGSWGTKSGPYLLRATSRRVGDFKPYDTGIFTGFRCAADLR